MRIDPKNLTMTKSADITSETLEELCVICGQPGAFEGMCDKCYMAECEAVAKVSKEYDDEHIEAVKNNGRKTR